MNKSILNLAIVLTTITFASISMAQTTGGTITQSQPVVRPRVDRQKLVIEILSKMDLTTEQRGKIKALMAKSQKEIDDLQKLIKSGVLKKSDAEKKRQELNKSALTTLRSILTRDQAKNLAAKLKESTKKAQDEAINSGSAKSGG